MLQSEPIDFAKQNEDDYEPPFEALKKQQQQILEQDYPSRQQKLNCVLYLSRIGMDLKQLCEDYGVTREEVIVAQTRPVDMFQGKDIPATIFLSMTPSQHLELE